MDAIGSDPPEEERITKLISDMESGYPLDDSEQRFDSLLGLYDVSYVKTKRARDNPVGGKWTRKSGLAQKILKTRRTFQHLLPVENSTTANSSTSSAVAQAVNIVSLEALGGLVRLTVILRGDAVPLSLKERTNVSQIVQPLSSRAVKVLFEPPRIVFGRQGRLVNIYVGPTTTVLLDTTYCDKMLRIGMGGTSGTRFVFTRCEPNDSEANEFSRLLEQKPAARSKALAFLGAVAASGIYGACSVKALRVFCSAVGILSVAIGAVVATSGGGIEAGDRSIHLCHDEVEKASA